MLAEPLLNPYGEENLHRLREYFIRGVCERRDVWTSRQQALEHLRKSARLWDPRALDVYIVRSLPKPF